MFDFNIHVLFFLLTASACIHYALLQFEFEPKKAHCLRKTCMSNIINHLTERSVFKKCHLEVFGKLLQNLERLPVYPTTVVYTKDPP